MKDLTKTLTYTHTFDRIFPAWYSAAAYSLVLFFNDDSTIRLRYSYLLLFLAIPTFSVLYTNYRMVKSGWTLQKWNRVFYFIYMLPFALVAGALTGLAPNQFVVGFVMFPGITMVGIGLYGRSRLLFLAFVFFSFYTAVVLVTNVAVFLDLLVENSIGLVASLSVAFWMGTVSERIIGQNQNLSKLLRSTRRDKRSIAEERKRSENLLLNILPQQTAEELKKTGRVEPISYDSVTVCFTDFVGFTQIAESMDPKELVGELDRCFSFFDSLMSRHRLEKLKTIGDSYMFVGGLPEKNRTHAIDCCLAAFEIQAFMNQMKRLKSDLNLPYWELRLGMHSGPVVAGVIGEKKFAFDIWSDTVNTASRCESSGVAGRINISGETYSMVSPFFECEYRGLIPAKNKGNIEMYFLDQIKPELSLHGSGKVPGQGFLELYTQISQ